LNQQGTSDLTTTTGKTAGNFYGRLESTKLPAASLARPPIVVDLKKQQSSNQQVNKVNKNIIYQFILEKCLFCYLT